MCAPTENLISPLTADQLHLLPANFPRLTINSTASFPSSIVDRSSLSRSAKMTILINVLKFYGSVPIVMLSSSVVGYLCSVPTLRFWSRALTCYCSVLLCASYGVIASIVLRMVGRATLAQWTTGRSFAWLTSPLIGWEWDVEGEEILAKNRPAVFISNHQRLLQMARKCC